MIIPNYLPVALALNKVVYLRIPLLWTEQWLYTKYRINTSICFELDEQYFKKLKFTTFRTIFRISSISPRMLASLGSFSQPYPIAAMSVIEEGLSSVEEDFIDMLSPAKIQIPFPSTTLLLAITVCRLTQPPRYFINNDLYRLGVKLDAYEPPLYNGDTVLYMKQLMYSNRLIPGLYLLPSSINAHDPLKYGFINLDKVTRKWLFLKRTQHTVDMPHTALVTCVKVEHF